MVIRGRPRKYMKIKGKAYSMAVAVLKPVPVKEEEIEDTAKTTMFDTGEYVSVLI